MNEFYTDFIGDEVGGGDAGIVKSEEWHGPDIPMSPCSAPDPSERVLTPEEFPVNLIMRNDTALSDETVVIDGMGAVVIEMRRPRPFVPWTSPTPKDDPAESRRIRPILPPKPPVHDLPPIYDNEQLAA